jgi:dihydrodipicolinate synthase/N-acetylneuraminate lyase
VFGRRPAANEPSPSATPSGAIAGVYAAAVTPHRLEGHEADYGAMLELVDYLAQGGVNGICLLGATGEFLHIKPAERIRLVHLAVKRSRVPILAGVSHSTLDGAVELAEEAVGSGVQGLLLMPPYFYRYGEQEITEFYLRFAEQMEPGVPILLYNIPQFSNGVPIDCARTLLASGRFAGIKDSSGDRSYLQSLLALKAEKDFVLMVGNDNLLVEGVRASADGVVSGVACALPELISHLYADVKAGDAEATKCRQKQLSEFIGWIDRFPTPVGIKIATALRGRKVGPPSVPLAPYNLELLKEFESWLLAWMPGTFRAAQQVS